MARGGWPAAADPGIMTGMTVIELSHPIKAGMVTYPGLPAPRVKPFLTREESTKTYAPGTTFQINRISLIGNTGTYVDSPAHRHDGGADLSGLPLERLADLPGLVVRVPEEVTSIDRSHFTGYDVGGLAVLVHTGWDRHFGTSRYAPGKHPHLTADAAGWLVTQDAALVGIDSVNIDGTGSDERPVHTALLAAGIPIVEHLTGLDRLPDGGFRFHAAPPRIVDMVSFPVRAYAVL